MYKTRMFNYYPQVIQAISEFKAIIDGEYPEFEDISNGKDTVLTNSYLMTMGEDRIKQWERVFGIKPVESSTIDDRRDVILARIRGQGKFNSALINSIVNTFTGGTAESWVKDSILYVSITPPPTNKQFIFSNVEQEIAKKLPAHLGLQVSRNYCSWSDIKFKCSTWQDVNNGFDSWNSVLLLTPFEQKYTILKYIESTGTQYINTGFTPNQNTRVVIDYEVTEIQPTFIFGCRKSAVSDSYVLVISSTSSLSSSYGDSGNKSIISSDTNRHTIDKNKNCLYLDGVLSYTYDVKEFTAYGEMDLFSCNNDGTHGYSPSYVKLYSCKIYDNDIIVRDFVPCINSNGEVGLWDKVDNRFYGNNGSGSFEYSFT